MGAYVAGNGAGIAGYKCCFMQHKNSAKSLGNIWMVSRITSVGGYVPFIIAGLVVVSYKTQLKKFTSS